MGLFNKLKNALFEEEEIDLEPALDKVIIKDEEEPAARKKEMEVKKEEVSLENERELFKAENTFNFPDFDEEEFVTNYEQTKPMTKIEEPKEEKRIHRYEEYEKKEPRILYEQKVKPKREKEVFNEKSPLEKSSSSKKTFIPSPTISPVYGIMDKSFKKEEYLESERKQKLRKSNNIDEVRKKAFGPVGENLPRKPEKREERYENNYFKEENKSLDDLLKDSIDETIELNFDDTNEFDPPTSKVTRDTYQNDIENELNREEENLNETVPPKRNRRANYEEDLPKRKENLEEETVLEDTLENDLYNLIDAMYDSREEE